jgi:hypothetical protein
MACGDEYRHLIRNAQGYTAQEPCGTYCNDADHELWNQAAKDLLAKVRLAYEAVPQTSLPEGLAVDFTTYTFAVLQLAEPSGLNTPGDNAGYVAAAISTMDTGVCILERAQKAITAGGGTPIEVPGTTEERPKEIPWWHSLAVGTGLVVGGYIVFRILRR